MLEASTPSPVPRLIARSMLSFGMLCARAAWIALRKRGFPLGSPPPVFAAMVLSFDSLLKIRPRLTSIAPLKRFAIALRSHVRQSLRAARINGQIIRTRIFADDHPSVNVLLRSDEKPAAILSGVQRVSRARSVFHRNHHSTIAPFDLAFERRVFS